ncbi:MAG: aspartate/glutamate racemase family protein [Vicinamibacteria bacterium]
MRIRVITPITTAGFTEGADFEPLARGDTEISQTNLTRGPASIESEFEEALAVPDTVAKIAEAEREGVDAVVIDCMGDPGLEPAREVVEIPVLGAAQSSMHLAAMLAHNFSVVTVLDRLGPLFENTAKVYGLESKLCSVRSVNIPVLDLEEDQERLVDALADESVKAVEEDGAHAIVFGCTGMKGCAAGLKAALEVRGYAGIPVIDPVVAAFKLAEAVSDLGLTHSKRTYPTPPPKAIVGYDFAVREPVPS